MRFSIDPWDVDYGSSADRLGVEPSTAAVVVDLERAEHTWSPIAPPPSRADGAVLFVDGVRRIDAHIWIDDADGETHPGLCATFAAGAVRCERRAEVVEALVERGMFSAAPGASDVTTRLGAYPARMAAGSDPEQLMLAVHERMTRVEVAIAEAAASNNDVDLIVIDGPLRGRQHLPRTVGFIKSHAVRYLPDDLHRLVARLAPGERTPVFTIGSDWSRHAWYLRLPTVDTAHWAGIVRCECSADLTPEAAVAVATDTAARLGRFASEPHKDTRAPQNLVPIGGLERELRRRLGYQQLLYRALREAAAGARGG